MWGNNGWRPEEGFLGTSWGSAESNLCDGCGYLPGSAILRKVPNSRVRRLSVLLMRSAATVAIGAALVCGLIAQEKKKPGWKDAAEYDFYKPPTQRLEPKLWLIS